MTEFAVEEGLQRSNWSCRVLKKALIGRIGDEQISGGLTFV